MSAASFEEFSVYQKENCQTYLKWIVPILNGTVYIQFKVYSSSKHLLEAIYT